MPFRIRNYSEGLHEYAVKWRLERNSVKKHDSFLTAAQQHIPATKQRMLLSETAGRSKDAFYFMRLLHTYLEILDEKGWNRSYHQRLFHEAFFKSVARVFFKLEPPGSFERNHRRVLETYNFKTLPQEVLISTPRRFGKTIATSLFAAALFASCPGVEISIYSTCRRISAKILRNIVAYFNLIMESTDTAPFQILRLNQEEFCVQGSEGIADRRIVNSYPSKTELSRTKTLTLILNDGVIDLSEILFRDNNQFSSDNYVHWNRASIDDAVYLPATFLRQKLCRGIYAFSSEELKVPFVSFLPASNTQLPNDGWTEAIYQSFQRLMENFSGREFKIVDKTSLILQILHRFTMVKDYSALVDFRNLRDTFDMRVQKSTLTKWKSALVDMNKKIEKNVEENTATLREFHTLLLECLYFYYIMGVIRILTFYALFDNNNDIKANPAYIKMLHRAGKCLQGGEDLILNSVIPEGVSFCNEQECKTISKFKRNGSGWLEIFDGGKNMKSTVDLLLPKMQQASVYSENGLLKVSWHIEEGALDTLIDDIVKGVASLGPATDTNKLELNTLFPKKRTNKLNFTESGNVTPDEIKAMQKNLVLWPIYSILKKQSDLKHEDDIGKRRDLTDKIKNHLSTVLPNTPDSLKHRILNKITSGMWSSALQDFIEIMFRADHVSIFTTEAQAFLELSGLALNYVTYLDRNNNVESSPLLESDYMKIRIKQDDTTETLFGVFEKIQISEDVFNLEEQKWVYLDPGSGKYVERECTKIQSFILLVAYLLGKKSSNSGVSILRKLSNSINFTE